MCRPSSRRRARAAKRSTCAATSAIMRLEDLAARRSRRRGARPASRRRSGSKPRPRSPDAAGRAGSARSGRAAPVRRSRRRCRTGSRPWPAGSTSGVQPVAASRASVSRSTISSSMPTSSRTRSRKSMPLSAARQASVAISRARVTPRLRILARQTRSASTARTIAASLSRPEAVTPSPSRMMRENASITRKPSRVGARHQQPAIVGAEIERGIGRAGQVQSARAAPPRSWRGCR